MMKVENEKIDGKCMIGTWAWGSGLNGSRMVYGEKSDREELKKIFKRACQMGFVMWDTAEVYGKGNAERILGECISEYDRKDQLYISTKFCPGKKFKDGSMEHSLGESEKRLGIVKPDIYWIHIPNDLKEHVKAAFRLQKEGKIGSLGLSNVSLQEIIEMDRMLKKEGHCIGGIQNHYSLLSRDNGQEEIIEWCKKNQVKYYAYMVLEQGALSGHYNESHPFPRFSMRGFAFGKDKFRRIAPLLAYEKELAEKYNINSAQIPVLWAIAKGTIPIVGMTKEKYVDELSRALKYELLPEEVAKLESLASESGVYCKGSWEPHK